MRIVIFGNSGSGKSTLAKQYATLPGVVHLDLDTLAWKVDEPGVREDLNKSKQLIDTFTSANTNWVIEGCYASLILLAANKASEIIFLNPGIKACQSNCRARPWEPHKYKSKEDQDKNLEMLLAWVADYESRTDEFSLAAHKAIFENFNGNKEEITSNNEAQKKAIEITA
jgi:adenylate kinase family enzyme